MNQLTIVTVEVLQTLQHNELNNTVINVSRKLDEEIERLEAIVDKVPSVWLEWSDEWLVGGMRESRRVCEGVSYVHRQIPMWTGVNKGERQNQLYIPCCLATNSDNGEVFVCHCSLVAMDYRVVSLS